MEAVLNPYAPGAGAPPPELAGRDDLRENARVVMERIRRGLPAKSIVMVGLRGVGKTVLLDRIREGAQGAGIQSIRIDAPTRRSLPALLAPELRLILLHLSRMAKSREISLHALRALAGFARAVKVRFHDVEVDLDAEPEPGLADSGNLQQDLHTLFEAVASAAQHADTAVALFIDDLQFLPEVELAALITALYACAHRKLPIVLVGSGLPQVRSRLSNANSCAELLFDFPEIGVLSPEAATRALREPADELNVQFEDDAVANILAATQCYPYFLQELAKQAWNTALRSPITLRDTRNAACFALAALDEKFFRYHFDRVTPAEKKYLRAMAELGPGTHRSGKIAEVLNRPVTSVGPARSQLIAKGMIWSAARGDTAFTVPRFDEFMRRTWPGNSWRN